MKKFNVTLLLFVSFLCFSNFVHAQKNAALEFNNLLVKEQNLVSEKNLEYVSYSVHSEDFKTVEKKRLDVVKQIDASYKVISKQDAPEEVSKMKEEVLEVLKMYKNVFTLDFVEVNKLKAKKQSSYEAMEGYFKAQDDAEKKLSKAAQRFAKAQDRFAKKMDITLEVDKEDLKKAKDIAVINEVYGYTRQIFLAQFKVSKADAEFMEGLSAQKSATYLDNKRKKLEEVSAEAIKILKGIKSFKGDSKYKDSALDLVKFYAEMAKKDYSDMVELSRMQAKNPKKLSNSEITKYNDLVNDYNDSIGSYNKKMKKLTSKFNDENSNLLQKYVPNVGIPKGKVQKM